jgi:hypothetical protein
MTMTMTKPTTVFSFPCTSCAATLRAGRGLIGRHATCPRCKTVQPVPDPDAVVLIAEPAAPAAPVSAPTVPTPSALAQAVPAKPELSVATLVVGLGYACLAFAFLVGNAELAGLLLIGALGFGITNLAQRRHVHGAVQTGLAGFLMLLGILITAVEAAGGMR